ncbi:hypothetical protein mRhiFer1_009693 [Rhinolophus ferrumequinum]|uniref:mitogen-activated protein kinase n=1 Tax=Rhinolophus ferrumequinum TaxID=59479 RepID=A0A7J7R0M2_RHIFE|nr:hypothetical protein mRhiFer1_009693 [Rhinolophus ferrumequinum]
MCAAEVDHHVAQRYLIKRRLGKGAYGIVWKAVDRRTGQVVAIKKIFDAFRDKTDAQRTFREIMLLQEFGDHPNIIRLLDVIRAENDRDIYLVFEFMDTDLHAIICKGRLLKDIHKRYIFYQLLRATKFIHSGRVIHRDQKPSNILLDASCLVKLCDFGLARSLSDLPEGPEGQALTEYVATRWYRAPEVLLSSSWYTPGVDMWSLGCILGEMLRGRPLFPGTSTLHQLELILNTIPPPSEEGHSRHWTPSCLPTRLRRPWISSGDSWCLPRTSGSAQPRHCSTPMCRGSTAQPVSGHWRRMYGCRCTKESSSRPPSIATASIRHSWRSQERSQAEFGTPAPASAPKRTGERGKGTWGDGGVPLSTLVGEVQRAGGGALPDLAGRRPGGHPGPDPEGPGPEPWGEGGRCATGASPAFPGGPARPKDVQRLGLTGGPGGR